VAGRRNDLRALLLRADDVLSRSKLVIERTRRLIAEFGSNIDGTRAVQGDLGVASEQAHKEIRPKRRAASAS